ncbi:MAG TPA: hypothetical protein VMM38_09225 [Aridibacter sp.]|nr:hypothetical protein [Aridibacter sp.]
MNKDAGPLDEAERQKFRAIQDHLCRALLDSEVGRLRAEFNLNESGAYVLKDHLKVEPVEEGSDKFGFRVYENGQPALEAGKEKTPEQLLRGWQENKRFSSIFNAGGGGGSGAPPNQNRGGHSGGENTMKWSEFNAMPQAKQTDFLLKDGQTVPD